SPNQIKTAMRDRLKRLFVGKPWTQKQIADWEKIRSKGKLRFVLLRFPISGCVIYIILFGRSVFRFESLGVTVPTVYFSGIVGALYLWSRTEEKYNQAQNRASSE